ncbi:hypothetical protein K2D_20310 [Planctomycetes bacterium K2D]|uniref:Peptidase MA-like domain-containing protein n=1 Tax=Botrimarina mediterranea TaxID=2528022 RepID=A0A518K7J4_9BACT|nr:hypothetical protein Spa11_19770 [Botrimarina mediterranea]QDV78424.1 hypothetical protein K2D_20310 [Planctomycetes bacterium K2D]
MRILSRRTLVSQFAAMALGATAFATESGAATRNAFTATAPSFLVRSFKDGPDAAEVIGKSVELRRKAHELWMPEKTWASWQPRCEIVLHSNRSSYLRYVGPSGSKTSGASLIERSGDGIAKRRIDLLVDQAGGYSALAHELTHVVLADWFGGRQPPPWVDEGIATLADSEEKQSLHCRDCRRALANGSAMQLVELVELRKLSSRDQAAAFYGQSLSLVSYLSACDKPEKLLPFVDLATASGYDSAIREVYGIDGIGALHRLWLNHELSNARSATLQAFERR